LVIGRGLSYEVERERDWIGFSKRWVELSLELELSASKHDKALLEKLQGFTSVVKSCLIEPQGNLVNLKRRRNSIDQEKPSDLKLATILPL